MNFFTVNPNLKYFFFLVGVGGGEDGARANEFFSPRIQIQIFFWGGGGGRVGGGGGRGW